MIGAILLLAAHARAFALQQHPKCLSHSEEQRLELHSPAKFILTGTGKRFGEEPKVTCPSCHSEFDYAETPEAAMGAVKCPACDISVISNPRR